MRRRRFALLCALAGGLSLTARVSARDSTGEWQPIDPADLAMKSEPLDPGAVAIFLYREIVSDDNAGTADYYFRIKILTDAGKKWATVEIPYIG